MDKYIAMSDTPEVQDHRELKDDSRFYVKEDIWNFRDSDAEERKQEFEVLRKYFAEKHPERKPIKEIPLLEKGKITISCYPLGEDGDNDCATVWNLLTEYPDKFIWLPRQENIQEMMDLDVSQVEWFASWAYDKYEANGTEYNNWENFKTITELWLAFYMKEVHSRMWSEEKGWR